MRYNEFVWADLSTFGIDTAKDFYHKVFGWDFPEVYEGYHMAQTKTQYAAGIYEMPEKFVKMNMPSFWMSYVQVEDLQASVNKAKELGAIIELVEDQTDDKIALIRDPSGAGFTLYQGEQYNVNTDNMHGMPFWNELYVSDATPVISFYTDLFGWNISPEGNDRYMVKNDSGNDICAIQQVPDDVKGDKQYWAIYFTVDNAETAKKAALENGGKLVYEDEYGAMFTDPYDAFFYIVQA